MNTFFKYFFDIKVGVIFSALLIASIAALFSITGFGKLFAGSMIAMMVLAGGLELGKLIGVSILYRYWDELPRKLRNVLLVISVIIMGITSAGIYGYVTAAYAKVAATPLQMNAQIGIIKSQLQSVNTELDSRTTRLNQIIAMRQQQENRIDTLIAKGLSARTAQSQVGQLNTTANQLQKEISDLSIKKDSLNSKSITTEVSVKTNSDIGTFIYVAEALGVSLDTVVKWFVLIIVLVFDPLSICLVLTYNFLVTRKETKKTDKKEPEIEEKNENPVSLYIPPEPSAEIVEDAMIKRPEENHLSEQEVLDKLMDINSNGIPDWMEANYDWDKGEWHNNPLACLYKKEVVDKRR